MYHLFFFIGILFSYPAFFLPFVRTLAVPSDVRRDYRNTAAPLEIIIVRAVFSQTAASPLHRLGRCFPLLRFPLIALGNRPGASDWLGMDSSAFESKCTGRLSLRDIASRCIVFD